MADELEKFLEEQRAKLARDKIKLDQDPPYMEMRAKSSEPVGATNQAADSTANGKSLPIIQPMTESLQTDKSKEENNGLSLPLGLEYDQKKQKLKEELRQDYRRYMAEKNSRIVRELQPAVESLSLPISDRKSAKDRLRIERNQEYNQLLREQDKYEQLRRDGRWIPKYYKENIDPSAESRFQAAHHLRSGQPPRETVSYKNDAYASMEAYEELLNKKRQEEDRYRRSDDPEVGQRRNAQTQTDRSKDYEINFQDSNNYFERLKNGYRQYKERRDQELPTYIGNEYMKEHRGRPFSATEKSRYLINEVHDSPRERSKSASVKDDAIFGTSLLLGNNERESAQRRRRERYRQELLEQISERQKSRKREKELELSVAVSGAVDPEKAPDRIRQFGAVMHQHNSCRRGTPDQRVGVPIANYSNAARSVEGQPPELPRVAFQTPVVDDRNLNVGLTSGMWNPLRNIMAPRVTAAPPPPPPLLTEHYHTPYDNAYYFYGARNPLDPNLAYYGPGVIGAQPMSLINPPNGLANIPMQGYPHTSSVNQSVPNVHDATTVRNLDGGFLPEQQAVLSKESPQTYQEFLKKQMQEREERKKKEKEETQRYDAKLEQEMKIYNPWGRGGGGAPLRDAEGNLLTDLKKMHKQNENAYKDFPHQGNQGSKVTVPLSLNLTRLGTDTPQGKAQGFTFATASQFSQGNSIIEQQTERKVPDQEKYKEYLRLQIEEKRRKAEEEREKCKLEEQREERRLAEQRARIAKELEEEQEKKRRKEEEQRLKNEEIVRLAEERRKVAERKRKEEEEKQEELFRQQAERKRSARVDEKRPPSPPIPTVKNKQVTIQRADLFPSGNDSEHELDLDHPHSGTKSPPVPARRNQLRAYEEKRDIISELSALRRQLRSEERRLEDQFQNADMEDDGTVAMARKRERNHVDVFDLARQRIQALVHRPSSKGIDSVNLQNIREFNDLKYRDSATRAQVRQMYPDPPNDSNTLEIQQEALLREQKKKLDNMKRKGVSCMNSRNIELQTRDSQEDLTKNSLLDSESAFLGSHGETFPYPVDVETTACELPPRERRRRNRSRQDLESEFHAAVQPVSQPDRISLHSASSFNVDQVRARNEQRMKRLHDLQHSGNDITTDDDILSQFISKDNERPSSVETEATDVWLRPGTSETLKRFMADHMQLDRGPSANTSAFNWRRQGYFTAND